MSRAIWLCCLLPKASAWVLAHEGATDDSTELSREAWDQRIDQIADFASDAKLISETARAMKMSQAQTKQFYHKLGHAMRKQRNREAVAQAVMGKKQYPKMEKYVKKVLGLPFVNPELEALKNSFMAEIPKNLTKEDVAAMSHDKTIADRFLRNLEKKVMDSTANGPIETVVQGIEFGLEWGAMSTCPFSEGFAMNFQYQRDHKVTEGILSFNGGTWQQRYGWVFPEGLQIWAQQNFPEDEDSQRSGLFVAMPYEAVTLPATFENCPLGHKGQVFHVGLWLHIPTMITQTNVGDSEYKLTSEPEFYWRWDFPTGNHEPKTNDAVVGAYVEFNGYGKTVGLLDWFSFYFGQNEFILQYCVESLL